MANEENQRLRDIQEDEHFFINDNGRILQQKSSEESPSSSSLKRKREDPKDGHCSKKLKTNDGKSCSSSILEAIASSSKKKEESSEDSDSEEEVLIDKPLYDILPMGCLHSVEEDKFAVDDGLSNGMLPTLFQKGQKLERLHVAGCAIDSIGLREILQNLANLKYINVMYTLASQKCVDELRNTYPNVEITDVMPKSYNPNKCTVFCETL